MPQLHDLEGDIVAIAAISETETKLLDLQPTEFGVPVDGALPKYSWLGEIESPSELSLGDRHRGPLPRRCPLRLDPLAGAAARPAF